MAGLLSGLALAACAQAQDPDSPFSPSGRPGYADAGRVIDAYVRDSGASGRNDLCLIGYRSEDGEETGWLHWRQADSLTLYPPGLSDLTQSNRRLDLKTDVVPRAEDTGTSSYLVDRAWLERILKDCRERGVQFVVVRP